MKKICFLFLSFILILFSLSYLQASAGETTNIKPTYGLLDREDSELTWDETRLIYSVRDFNSLANPQNELTMTYTIYNPTKDMKKETLFLPFYEEEGLEAFIQKNTKIWANGLLQEPRTRYMYSEDAEKDLYQGHTMLSDIKQQDDFFQPSLSVYEITLTLEDRSTEKLEIELPKNIETRVIVNSLYTLSEQAESNLLEISLDEQSESIQFYILGTLPENIQISEDFQIEQQEMTLEAFIEEFRPEKYKEVDWYNIIFDQFLRNNDSFVLGTLEDIFLSYSKNILTMLEFDLLFEANHAITISVSTPIFLNSIGDHSFSHLTIFNEKCKGEISGYISGSFYIEAINNVVIDGYQEYFRVDNPTSSFLFTMNDSRGPAGYSGRIEGESAAIASAILIIFLYLIPMAIMLVLFIQRKNKKGNIMAYVEKFLSYSLFIIGLVLLIITNEDITTTPLIYFSLGLGALTVLSAIETYKSYGHSIIGLVIATAAWILEIYMLATKAKASDICAVFIFIFLLYFVFTLFWIHRKNSKTKSIQCLPLEFLYRWEILVLYIYFTITLTLSFIFVPSGGYFVLAIFFILYVYFIILILINRFIHLKPFFKLYKNLDVNRFVESLEKIINIPYLNPETRNKYLILFTKHMLIFNKGKFYELLKDCKLPKAKRYMYEYSGLSFHYGQTKEEFDNAFEKMKREYYDNKLKLKKITKFYEFWQPYYGTNLKVDIARIYKYDTKKPYVNAVNLFVLIYYFYNEGNLSKVKELKTLFMNKYSMIGEFVKDLDQLN